LLGVALALRAMLVMLGGQLYFPDEARYLRSMEIYDAARTPGLLAPTLDALLRFPPHMVYSLVGTLAEAPRRAVASMLERPADAASPATLLWIPALLFSLTSVGSIALTYGLVLRTGGSRSEGRIAALLMTCSTSMLYFARHLLPYDGAMFVALLGLWIALAPRVSAWRSFLVGVVGALAFLTYNGYWVIAVVVVALHVLQRPLVLRTVTGRSLAAGLGFASMPLLVLAISVLRHASPVESLRGFASAVTQGDFSEGWSVPWEYLWHTEHTLLLVWTCGAGLVAWRALRGAESGGRGVFWLGGVLLVYGLLVLGSSVLHLFVTYGRLTRQMIPFLCLAAAAGWSGSIARRSARRAAVVLIVLAAALNAAPVFRQRFPNEIERVTAERFGAVPRASTFKGCCDSYPRLDPPPEAPPGDANYVLVNAGYLYPVEGVEARPPGKVVFRVAHPLAFLPYQYESYGAQERAILRAGDLSMMLIERER